MTHYRTVLRGLAHCLAAAVVLCATGIFSVARAELPASVFLRANHACKISGYYGSIRNEYSLDDNVDANDGGSWYVASSGFDRVLLDRNVRLTTSVVGYTNSWYTYSKDLQRLEQEGPSSATLLLAGGNYLDVSTVSNQLHKTVTGPGLIYAVFTPITYSLSYELDGGEFAAGGSHPETAVYDQSFTVSAPIREFYAFRGWKVGEKVYYKGESNAVTFVNLTAVQGETVAIGAQWEANKYPLQLALGEGVEKIHYRTSSKSDWLVTTSPLTVGVSYGETWSAWAEPAYGYEGTGTGWSEEGVTGALMTEKGDRFKPVATKKHFTLKATASPATGGSVTGSGSYEYLTQVELSATAARGHSFAGWSDGALDNPYNVEVLSNVTIKALFTVNDYTLKLTVSPGVSNILYRLGGTGDFISVTNTCKIVVPYGTKYDCYATPLYGYTLSGIGSSEENLWSGTMSDGDLAFVPSPSKCYYRLTLQSSPAEAGRASGAGNYEYLALAYLTATAEAGYKFAGWSDGSTENPYWYPVVSNATLTARFSAKSYPLELVVGEGIARIWYEVGSETNSTDVSVTREYPYGTSYKLWAEAKPGYVMSGSGSSKGSAVRGTLKSDGYVFEPKPTKESYRVTVAALPAEGGMVSGSGAFAYGENATLSATPNEGYELAGWSDGSAENPHYVTVCCATNVTARFAPRKYTLQLVVGEGVARISYSLDGSERWLSTDATLVTNVAYGTQYRLYAETLPGYEYTGAGSSMGSAVSGKMTAAGFVFEPKPTKGSYSVVAVTDPSEGGETTVQPFGKFSYKETALASVTVKEGYYFIRWDRWDSWNGASVCHSNACANPIYSFEVTSNVSLVAVLSKKPCTVTFVVKDSSGYEIGLSQTVAYGESAVEPSPEKKNQWEGHTFLQWDTTAWQSVTGDMTVYAQYAAGGFTVNFDANGGTGAMKSEAFVCGTEKTLTASAFTAPTGYTFAGWSTEPFAAGAEFYRVDYKDQEAVTFETSGSVTLYAVWDPITYKIVFDANKATGSMDPVLVKYNEKYTLPKCSFETNTSFVCWKDKSTDVTYADQEVVTRLSSDPAKTVTLLAQWAGGCSVNFHANYEGAKKVLPVSVYTQYFAENTEDALRANTFTRDGYTFAGWATSEKEAQSFSVTYADQALVTDPAKDGKSIDLYAVWKTNTYQVVFDANGKDVANGDMPKSPQNFIYGQVTSNTLWDATSHSKPADGFLGWHTNANATAADQLLSDSYGVIKVPLSTISNDHVRLYAIWKDGDKGAWSKALGCDNLEFGETGDPDSPSAWIPDSVNGGLSFGGNNSAEHLLAEISTSGTLSFEWQPTEQGSLEVWIYDKDGSSPKGNIDGAATKELRGGKWGEPVTCAVSNVESPAFIHFVCGDKDDPVSIRNVKWTPCGNVDCKVTFCTPPECGLRVGGGSLTQTVSIDKFALEPTIIGVNGWDFKGWAKTQEAAAAHRVEVAIDSLCNEKIGGDTTFYAVFEPHVYDIIYANKRGNINNNVKIFVSTNGWLALGSQGTLTQAAYEYADLIAIDGKTNLAAVGWSPKCLSPGVYWNESTRAYTNVVTQARWESMVVKTNPVYTVTFVSGEDSTLTSATRKVEKGKSVSDLPMPADIPGMSFVGWDKSLDNVTEDFTTVAQYTEVNYPITYLNLKGSTHENPTEYSVKSFDGRDAITINPPKSKEDTYAFLGWMLRNEETGEVAPGYVTAITNGTYGALAFTASWGYRVQFSHTAGYHVSAIVGETGQTLKTYVADAVGVTNALAICAPGYSFAGWQVTYPVDTTSRKGLVDEAGYLIDATGNRVLNGGAVSNVTESLELMAVATANVYTVTFKGGEGATGEMDDQAFTYDVEQKLNKNQFAKVGCEFAGWQQGEGAAVYTDEQVVKNLATGGVVTLRAVWNGRTYPVTFAIGEHLSTTNDTEVSVKHGESVALPEVTADAGYSLDGWYGAEGNRVQGVEVANVTNAATYSAVATANVYTVTFKGGEGATGAMADQAFTYDVEQKLNKNQFAKVGCEFVKWRQEEGEAAYTDEQSVKNLVTGGVVRLVAVWDKFHTVKFLTEGGVKIEGGEQKVQDGGDVVLPAATPDKGWAFKGWYDAEGRSYESTVTNVMADLSLTAVATACVYRITYEDLHGAPNAPENPATYTVTNAITFAQPGTPTEPGEWRFAGWDPTGIEVGTTGDVTTVALWGNRHKVTVKAAGKGEVGLLDAEGNVAENPGWYLEGTNLTAVAEADEGWLFKEWKDGADSHFVVSNAVELTAVFTQTVHTVVIDGVAKSVGYGEQLTNSVPLSVTDGGTNVVCVGWIGTGDVPASGTTNEVTFTVTQESSLTWLYATNYWVKVSAEVGGDVTVFDGEGKAVAQPGWFAAGTNLVAEATASEGWKFKGWEGAAGLDNPLSIAVDAAVALTAKFVRIHTVTFELGEHVTRTGGGELVQQVVDGGAAVAPEVKADKGYEFTGWDRDFGRVTADMTVAAEVEKVIKLKSTVTLTCDAERGKVTGAGTYAIGKKVTVKATAYKGYVFTGWYDEQQLVSGSASYAFYIDEDDVAWSAKFITSEKDAASVRVGINGIALFGEGVEEPIILEPETNVWAGIYLEWPVKVSETTDKLTVSGLPSGLKFTAKDILDSKTKAVKVPAMTIYGTPTVGGKTSKVKVTATTAGKTKVTSVLEVTVDALPAELVGTYGGGATNDPCGSATVTLAKSGKVSGKWISEGLTWTMTAANLTGYNAADESFSALVTLKCGKLVDTLPLTFAVNELGLGVVKSERFTATFVNWKVEPRKTEAKELKGEISTFEAEGVVLTAKVGTSGAVTVAGEFDVGLAKPYKVSAKGTLVPLGGGRYEIFVYYPPKSTRQYDFDGYAVRWCN